MENNPRVSEIKEAIIIEAYRSFLKKGIDKSYVEMIALDAGYSVSTLFKYFKNKANLILEVIAYCWEKALEENEERFNKILNSNLNGRDKTYAVLLEYVRLFKDQRENLMFLEDAEVFLWRQGLVANKDYTPIRPSIIHEGPLAEAIKLGVYDKTLVNSKELAYFYANSFDCILGLMQKLCHSTYDEFRNQDIYNERLEDLCKTLVIAISNNY